MPVTVDMGSRDVTIAPAQARGVVVREGPQGIQGERGPTGVQGPPGEVSQAELDAALAAHVAAADPHPQYVEKSGDTMTGRLTISEGSLQLGTTAAADGRVYAGNQLVVYKAGTSSLTTVAHANATFGNQSATLSQALVLFGDGLPLAQARALGLSVVTDENGTPVGVPVGEVLGLLLARLAEGGVSL